MKSAALNFYSKMRASYWYIPSMMVITAILLSILTIRIDHMLDPLWIEQLKWFQADNPEGARTLLSTIATSMITVAGVTFSMTIVAVAFAASQIGPRLISNFMRDRNNQFTLGTFIATFTYCILILRSVYNPKFLGMEGRIGFVPQLSLLVAVLLALCSIMVLIYFIHHIPESILNSKVIGDVGEELYKKIDKLFPSQIGREYPDKAVKISKELEAYRTEIVASSYGYIRILDGNKLIKMAQKHDVIIQLEARPGDFITSDTVLMSVYSAEKIPENFADACRKAFAYGHDRNQEQDMMFLMNQLIEIIARALSPGVNEPYTAIVCLDWIQSNMEKLSFTSIPSAYRYDNEETLRLIAHPVSFETFCEKVYDSILCYVAFDYNASLHMMHMLINMSNNIENPKHKISLASHAKALQEAACQCLSVTGDQQKIKAVYEDYFINMHH